MALFTTNTKSHPLPSTAPVMRMVSAVWTRLTARSRPSPEEALAATARRTAARRAVDNLLR